MKKNDPVRSDDDHSISLDAGVKEALTEVSELRDRKRKKIPMLTRSDRFNKGKTRIGFAFVDSNICIAIPIKLGRYLFEMPSRGKLDEYALQTTMADLKEILGVFDALELDSRPMSKDAPAAVPESLDTAELSTGNHIDPK